MEIIEARPLRETVLEWIKRSSAPVIIYGAGVNGRNICRFLEGHNVEVLAFVVSDGQPISEGIIENHPILFRSEINFKSGYNLVLATGNYPFEEELLADGADSFPACLGIERLALGDVVEMDYGYFSTHNIEFEQTYNWLMDDLSRNTMEAYINARIGGKLTRLLELADSNDYDFSILRHKEREVYVDCGAYKGSIIDMFLSSSPPLLNPEIFAFEPDSQIAKELRAKFSGLQNFHLIEKAAYSQSGALSFVPDDHGNSRISCEGSVSVETTKIDDVLGMPRATIIKMDVEGSELKALSGAESQLRDVKPRLAICVYHKPEDLITIPQYIKSINSDYRFLLRHHNKKWISELVLYAI